MIYRTRFLNPVSPPKSCDECGLLPDCGGLDGEAFDYGCFQRCESRCRHQSCDCVCPCAPVGFDLFWEEVGGICVPPVNHHFTKPKLQKLLPLYVAQVHHGGSRKRSLAEQWVSIPLRAITRSERGKMDIRFESRAELCQKLKIDPSSKIILSGVDKDRLIEKFWKFHRKRSLLSRISALEFHAVTTPNYSFMLDTPRPHSLHSLSRIFRMTERMSEAGINTIPHINASTRADWKKWAGVLNSHESIRYVAMEFQTGLGSDPERGAQFVELLRRTMDEVGRELHPVIMGGTGHSRKFVEICNRFTLVDSTPFMKAVKRQMLVPRSGRRPRWQTVQSSPGECIAGRLEQNIRLHQQLIQKRLGYAEQGERVQPILEAA